MSIRPSDPKLLIPQCNLAENAARGACEMSVRRRVQEALATDQETHLGQWERAPCVLDPLRQQKGCALLARRGSCEATPRAPQRGGGKMHRDEN